MMMGPPGQSEMDTRMSALESWRTPPAIVEEDKGSLVRALLPLVMSQAVDMMTTENLLSRPTIPGWQPMRELNPMPGMQTSGGRIGLQGLEAALVALAMAKKPKLGAAMRDAALVMHSGAAMGNQRNTDQMYEDWRVHRVRGR